MFKVARACFLFIVCWGSVSLAADKNFKVDKDSFYVKIKRLAITPIENTLFEEMSYLYEKKDPAFMASISGKLRFINLGSYAKLRDTIFCDSVETMAESLLVAKLKEKNRFEIFPMPISNEIFKQNLINHKIDKLSNPLSGRNKYSNSYEFIRQFAAITNSDAVAVPYFYLTFSEHYGRFVNKLYISIIDKNGEDTLWFSDTDVAKLRMGITVDTIFDKSFLKSAIKKSLKSIKEKK